MYVGKNCIAFYVWNGFVTWASQNIITSFVAPSFSTLSVTLIAFASFVLALPVIYVIVRLTMRYSPWLYGISRRELL